MVERRIELDRRVPPQEEDEEAEGQAGDGDRRAAREDAVQDQAAQPVLDRTRREGTGEKTSTATEARVISCIFQSKPRNHWFLGCCRF